MMRRRAAIFTLFILFTNAWAMAGKSSSSEEKAFWESYKKEDFKKAGSIGEKLGEANPDYLFLSALCDNFMHEYNTYHQKTAYYQNIKNGDYSSLKQLLEENYLENDPVLNNLMGVVQYLIPEIELPPSQQYFEKSVSLKHKNPIAHNYLSIFYLNNGEFQKGIKLSKQAIKEDKHYPEPYNNLAFAYFKTDEKQKAVDALIKCMRMCPKNTQSTYINFIQISCKEVVLANNEMMGVPGFENETDREHVIKKLKGRDNALLALASQFYEYRSYQETRLLLDGISPDQSNQNQYYLLKSMTLIAEGDTVRYDANVDKLVAFKDYDDVLNIGNFFYENGSFYQALKNYKKAESLATTEALKVQVLSNIGTIELQLGNFDKALEYYEQVLKINDKDDITLTNMGIAYAFKKDKTKAREYLLKAKAVCSSDEQMAAIEHWLSEVEAQTAQ